MNIPLAPQAVRCLLALFLVGLTGPLAGQSPIEVGITKIEPAIVTTPNVSYSGASQKSSPRSKSWMEIEVNFATALQQADPTQKYSDDLTVNYYVLLNNKSIQFPQGALLTGQTALLSVPAKENDLKTVIYISPRSLERFFDGKIPSSPNAAVIDIGVTISKGGKELTSKSYKGSGGAWWPQFQQTSGYLHNKSETPFASLNSDYYESVKKQ